MELQESERNIFQTKAIWFEQEDELSEFYD